MDQHAGRIALLTSELAMGEGGEGHEGVTVLAGQFGLAQTFDYLFHQLRKVSGAFLVAKTKVVEFRCLFLFVSTNLRSARSCIQPVSRLPSLSPPLAICHPPSEHCVRLIL